MRRVVLDNPGSATSEAGRRGMPVDLYGAELAPGASVASYSVEQLEHRGPCAALYRARHQRSGRAIALKVLHLELISSAKAWKRFQQEIATLASLRHPHIVRCLESGELWDGRPYLAMEWVRGSSLDRVLKTRGTFTAPEVWAVAKQIGAALGKAHARGIIHRDLKAENVMVLPRGSGFSIKLLDFGVAKHLELMPGQAGLTSTGLVLGTLSCIAPEQIRGDPVDARTDIYAFGVLLYQLATGRLPYEAANRTELEELHLYAPAPKPSRVASFGASFDAVVGRCLEKRPAFRFENIDELLRALRPALVGKGGDASGLALGLYVEVQGARQLDGAQTAPGRVEAIVSLGERRCLEGRLTVAIKVENALLAVAPLPTDPRLSRARRRTVLSIALEIDSELRRAATHGGLRVGVRLHAGEFKPKGEIGEGPLLALQQWTAPFSDQLLVSEAAARGLSKTRLRPSTDHPGFLAPTA